MQTDGSSWLGEGTGCTRLCCWSQALTSQLPRSSTAPECKGKIIQKCSIRSHTTATQVTTSWHHSQKKRCSLYARMTVEEELKPHSPPDDHPLSEKQRKWFPQTETLAAAYFSTCAICVIFFSPRQSAYWEAVSTARSSFTCFQKWKRDLVKITNGSHRYSVL